MNDQNNQELVQQAYSNFKSGNIESLLGLMSDDISWELPKIENVPFSGTRKGKEAVREFFAILASEQDVVEFNPMKFIAQGDQVVCLGNYKWRTHDRQEWQGEWAQIFTIRNGKVVSFHEYTDTAAAAAVYKKRMMA